MVSEKRKPPTINLPLWKRREEMVAYALSKSVPWFAFINFSFAVIVLCRSQIFGHADAAVPPVPASVLDIIDITMGVVIALAAGSLGVVFIGEKRLTSLRRLLFDLVFLLTGAIWAYSCYYFVTLWQLPVSYPLVIILILTALSALYFYPRGLLLYATPLWLSALLSNISLYSDLNLRFFVIWCLFSLILIYGRHILQHWFDENWQRHQDNLVLISYLDTLASQDPLTETANRRGMESHLDMAVAQRLPFALIMLDVDYFKRYNDHYGHQAGDHCLVAIARALKDAVRTPKDLVARYGGEEFLVLLPGASAEEAIAVAERIRAKISEQAIPHAQSEVSEHVTVSMGVTGYDQGKRVAELIAAADAALYRAKEQGRNRWCQ